MCMVVVECVCCVCVFVYKMVYQHCMLSSAHWTCFYALSPITTIPHPHPSPPAHPPTHAHTLSHISGCWDLDKRVLQSVKMEASVMAAKEYKSQRRIAKHAAATAATAAAVTSTHEQTHGTHTQQVEEGGMTTTTTPAAAHADASRGDGGVVSDLETTTAFASAGGGGVLSNSLHGDSSANHNSSSASRQQPSSSMKQISSTTAKGISSTSTKSVGFAMPDTTPGPDHAVPHERCTTTTAATTTTRPHPHDTTTTSSNTSKASSPTSQRAQRDAESSMVSGFRGRPLASVVAADSLAEGGREYVMYKIRVVDDVDGAAYAHNTHSGVSSSHAGGTRITSTNSQKHTSSITNKTNCQWTVSRRYSNFEQLHRMLRADPAYKLKLPPKRVFLYNQV